MSHFTIRYYGDASRRKFTPNQFLAEFAEKPGRLRCLDLPHAVTVIWAEPGEVLHRERYKSASALFAFFHRLHYAKSVLVAMRWKGCAIGPVGTYELNRAIREPAIRKGGLNIVRYWLETRRGCRTPLGQDLAALFDYLEIRPLFQRGKASPTPTATLSPTPTTQPQSASPLYIMSIILYTANQPLTR